MTTPKRKTIFEPVQMKAEPGWYVRITLPHGEQIHINEFITEDEAAAWIEDKSIPWLKKYRGGRYAYDPQTPTRPGIAGIDRRGGSPGEDHCDRASPLV
jgi:hypothetical protein